jgi:hypothetical protein
MTITEDTSLYLADFGVDVVAGSVTGRGILDMPSELIVDGQVITTDYTLTCETAKFGGLLYGSQLSVNGVPYTVRVPNLVNDGAFTQLTLQRDLEVPHTTSLTPINANGAAATLDDLGLERLDAEISGGTASTTYIDGNVINGGTA